MQRISTNHVLQASEQQIPSRIDSFFQHFGIGTLAHSCGITKTKGVSQTILFSCIFSFPFFSLNLYRCFATQQNKDFAKDAAYDFFRSSRFSWRRFLLRLAAKVCAVFQELTSDDLELVFMIDDSIVHRPRAKKIELLACVFDYSESKFLKCFRLLSLCWSDGNSLAPLDFVLLSSHNEKKRILGVTKQVDSRTCGAKRCQEAIRKSTTLIGPMLRRALFAGIRAKYLLMDRWFDMPSIIADTSEFLPVICMVKRTSKILYRFGEERLTVDGIFRTIKQHLDLEKGCQARYFDALIAHTTIVMMRYLFLALEQRRNDDPRIPGLLLHTCCEEMRDLDYLESLQLILILASVNLLKNKPVAEKLSQVMMAEILKQEFYIYGLNR
ncbi:transposase [Maridesulfovibrio sp.]|uniref:IS4 family transposase n=1 Tax=Maridesulfovibrio sp. TaxID=2795000 RepID=UPI0029C9FF71|nr:transposase [Maridesulfovibrio sp.]